MNTEESSVEVPAGIIPDAQDRQPRYAPDESKPSGWIWMVVGMLLIAASGAAISASILTITWFGKCW